MTLAEYVKRRNGVAMGSNRSLRNNLFRAFGAKNFAVFWTYWNPIFGYYLGTKIFKPIKTFLPVSLAILFTFVCCGMIHDMVTTVVRGDLSLIFTLWFFIMGCMVILSKKWSYNFSNYSWFVRAMVNVLCLTLSLLLTLLILQHEALPKFIRLLSES